MGDDAEGKDDEGEVKTKERKMKVKEKGSNGDEGKAKAKRRRDRSDAGGTSGSSWASHPRSKIAGAGEVAGSERFLLWGECGVGVWWGYRGCRGRQARPRVVGTCQRRSSLTQQSKCA